MLYQGDGRTLMEKYTQNISRENWKEVNVWDLADGRLIFKLTLKIALIIRSGVTWLRIGVIGGLLWIW